MESIEKYYDCLDSRTIKFLLIRYKPKKEFITTVGPEEAYNKIQESKVGYIKVHKISDNPGIEKNKVYEGITACFGEGLAMWLSNETNWFHTSVIQSIDWNDKTFKTLNSTYAFEFEELEYGNFANELLNLGINSVNKRYVKGHEC